MDWKNVMVEQAPFNPEIYTHTRQFTGGSAGIRRGWEGLRMAGATARRMLQEAAANAWNVPVEEITTETGVLFMAIFKLSINGKNEQVDVDPNTPLLWVLRDHLNLPGTKYGCGISVCGACTIHLGGVAMRSCQLPVSAIGNQAVTTIEGLSEKGDHM